MNQWLIVLLIVVVIAAVWYWQRERAKEAERKSAETRRLGGASERTPLAAPSTTARDGGAFQRAAEAATGAELERATSEMQEATAELVAAREVADYAAARLAAQVEATLAAVQAAAAAHGGAVPGDGTTRCPSGYPVKGILAAKIYYTTDLPEHDETVPDVCFQSAAAADAAGFAPARAEGVLIEDIAVAEESEPAGGPEAVFAEALRTSDRESGATSDVVAEAIAAADAGSVPPGAIRGDGGRDCPSAYPIKGNAESMLYHEPGSPVYQEMIPEFCFSSVESAQAAGFSAPRG